MSARKAWMSSPHEFIENWEDASMCVCGIPALDHDAVMANWEKRALAYEVRRSRGCHGIVTRDGEMDACEKPAVAIIDGRGTEAETYWPACAYHANRYGAGRCVSLVDLAAALVTR